MMYHAKKNRVPTMLIIAVYLITLIIPVNLFAQEDYCIYDRKAPSVESARESFHNKNYDCARWELMDLLELKKIKTAQKADALVLLAQVNYLSISDKQEMRSTVRKNLITAFRTCPGWEGSLEIRSSEFYNLLNDSKDIARKLEPLPPDTDEEEIDETALFEERPKKPWYKKWWVFGSGLGVMVMAVALILGDDDNTEPAPILDTLPYFPSSPSRNK
ncbi:MAG: hypothetical protein PHU88_04535 [candidate division Zixibacteria bacterium]|nr:hypothetical protein [candidate division Zixibacteria bacterium]MDD5426682.1 hypothetical protein [candidate division Zixibacteria bacterium]